MMADHLNPEIVVAAKWLFECGHQCVGAKIPVLRARFTLSALDAIEAMKQARTMANSGNAGDRSHER